ncbi:MAG: two component system histidine kinase, partial [uncultured bacterium]
IGSFTSDWALSQYGLFGMPVFIAFLAYTVVRFKMFNVKMVGAAALVFSLWGLVFSLLFLETNFTAQLIVVMTLVLVSFFGVMLIRSVRQEVKRREEIAQLAKTLEYANIRLQELDKQKTEFLSIASHQLRTPLSILKGYIELIKDGGYGKVTKGTVEVLNNMDESNEHLIKMVDDFLNISRLEQGRTKYVFADFDITHLIDGIVFELKKKAEDKNLVLEWLQKEPFHLVGDEEKIRHVIFNFVDNAAKYTNEGTIKVAIEKSDNGLKVTVRDHGFGFDKIDEANFFQKFYRGENVKGTNVTGTGLGLFVCKKFIEAHGGKVWAHSPGLGQGSEFGLWLPLIPTKPAETKI